MRTSTVKDLTKPRREPRRYKSIEIRRVNDDDRRVARRPHPVPGAVLALVGGGHGVTAEAASGRAEPVGSCRVRRDACDMPSVYRAADLVLLPSTHGENLPTVLIEAAGAGRAVVASRVGGIPDIVRDGETGLLFEPGNTGALADASSPCSWIPTGVTGWPPRPWAGHTNGSRRGRGSNPPRHLSRRRTCRTDGAGCPR